MTEADLADVEAVKKGDMWTPDEDALIMDSVMRFGQKWQMIAELLPGRSSNAVRNRFLRCCSGTASSEASWPNARVQKEMQMHYNLSTSAIPNYGFNQV
jgi:hypothetical protein